MSGSFDNPAGSRGTRQPAGRVLRWLNKMMMSWIRRRGGTFMGMNALVLTTVGRKSGVERKAILGYLDDGPNLVTMAMNGWASPEPKWWLNLQANPDATLEMFDGTRREVTAHAATGEERERLWALWNTLDEDYEGYTKLRSGETAIVVLEPRAGQTRGAAKG